MNDNKEPNRLTNQADENFIYPASWVVAAYGQAAIEAKALSDCERPPLIEDYVKTKARLALTEAALEAAFKCIAVNQRRILELTEKVNAVIMGQPVAPIDSLSAMEVTATGLLRKPG